jgi:hypothetical protein
VAGSVSSGKTDSHHGFLYDELHWLLSFVRSGDPDVQTTIYFSLFLFVFPIVAFLWNLWSGVMLVSIPLVLMLCCGLLSFRAARAIEKRRQD